MACVAGAAQADDFDRADARLYDSSDYSAQAYYRLDFGGTRAGSQSLGLRLDNERAAALGAPSMVKLQFGQQGLDTFTLNGLDLRQAVSSSLVLGGAELTLTQMIALGMAVVIGGTVVYKAVDENDPLAAITGGSGT